MDSLWAAAKCDHGAVDPVEFLWLTSAHVLDSDLVLHQQVKININCIIQWSSLSPSPSSGRQVCETGQALQVKERIGGERMLKEDIVDDTEVS